MTIWKYSIHVTDEQVIFVPDGAKLLSVQVQNGIPCIWALVDQRNSKVTRRFRVYGTGAEVDEVGEFVGTFQLNGGALVFHVFDLGVI